VRISTRLRIITGATVAVLVILVPVLVWSFVEFKSAKDDDALADALHDNYFERASYRDQYVLHREDRLREQWITSKHATDALVAQARSQFHQPKDQQLLDRFSRSIEDTAQLFDRIVANTQAMKAAGANRGVYEEFDKRLYSQLLLIATDVRTALATIQHSTERRVEEDYKILAVITSLFALTLALAVILVALQMDRMIRRRLLPLHRGVNLVAGGNLDYRIETEGSDEFTELAHSINNMSDKLGASTQRLAEEIAERAKAVTLRESDVRFRTFFEKNTSVMLLIDPASGEIIEANDAAVAYYGYPKTQLNGMTTGAINTLPPERIAEERQLALREERSYFLFQHRLASGALRDVEVYSTPIESGGRTLLYSIVHDITARKQVEEALRSSEEKFAKAFRSSPMFIAISAVADGRYVDVNENFLRTLGHTREEVIGHTAREIALWKSPEDRQRALEILRTSGRLVQFETELCDKGGRALSCEIWGEPITIDGQACVIWVTTDITERKRTEDQLRKLSLAVQQSPESIVITNLDGDIEYTNEAFVQKTGYSREEVIGKNPRILQSGNTPPETFAAMWQALTQGQPWNGDLHNRRKDGSEYIEHAVITPIRQPDGKVTHYVAVKEDITNRKASEDQINTLAFYDPLTSLPNRRLLLDRLKQALASSARSKNYGALLFIDMDNFKTLN
ncbi:MAG: PAS domain S-box protein, partial [Proteobacteria bacterium]|nr:PAS domain S-box protein [Pseudomonadota bacterium]